jgi:drug/metabolite transporter (DMT)-like permease
LSVVRAKTAWDAGAAALDTRTAVALGGNILLGLVGYYLRFDAIARLPVFTYALLSLVGIAMSYAYGYYFNGETVGATEVVGATLIFGACLLAQR